MVISINLINSNINIKFIKDMKTRTKIIMAIIITIMTFIVIWLCNNPVISEIGFLFVLVVYLGCLLVPIMFENKKK